jgi:hypothetical protein
MLRTASAAILAVATLAGASLSAIANTTPREDRMWGQIQAERERQSAVIERGRADGSQTFLESYRLRRERARTDMLVRDALADGRPDRGEWQRIRQAQDDTARHIAAERRDAQVRGWWWRLWR